MLSKGDLVNVIHPTRVPYYGIGEIDIRRMMENNPYTITTIFTEPEFYISCDNFVKWSCRLKDCEYNFIWPNFLLEAVYINREPDWEV